MVQDSQYNNQPGVAKMLSQNKLVGGGSCVECSCQPEKQNTSKANFQGQCKLAAKSQNLSIAPQDGKRPGPCGEPFSTGVFRSLPPGNHSRSAACFLQSASRPWGLQLQPRRRNLSTRVDSTSSAKGMPQVLLRSFAFPSSASMSSRSPEAANC